MVKLEKKKGFNNFFFFAIVSKPLYEMVFVVKKKEI